tara:strand:- start:27473 stop:28240 length:768 start_codon:yes stop_codon:yes gene_type:complete
MAFDLSSVSKSTGIGAPRILVYGTAGVGKTTFAAQAPNPVFIQTEDGAGTLEINSFPVVSTFEEFMQCLAALYNEHHYDSVVVDSLDHLEPLIWKRVCADNSVENIEKLGYGKGYVMALDYWREAMAALNGLRDQKSMAIILIAHHQIRKHSDPELEQIDRYEIKLHQKASGLVQESVDAVLFAKHKVSTKTEQLGFGNTRTRGISTGQRVLATIETPAFLAKNRYGMPAEIPLSWADFMQAINPSKEEKKNGTT